MLDVSKIGAENIAHEKSLRSVDAPPVASCYRNVNHPGARRATPPESGGEFRGSPPQLRRGGAWRRGGLIAACTLQERVATDRAVLSVGVFLDANPHFSP